MKKNNIYGVRCQVSGPACGMNVRLAPRCGVSGVRCHLKARTMKKDELKNEKESRSSINNLSGPVLATMASPGRQNNFYISSLVVN